MSHNSYSWTGVDGMDADNKSLIDSSTSIDPSFSQAHSVASGTSDDSGFNSDAALAVAKVQQAQQQAQQQAKAASVEVSDHHSPVASGDSSSAAGASALTRQGRPLTNTKRAQQNRQAQRAFRQRKELYIKDLEAKVTELKTSRDTIDALRQENIQLRDYILALQSRLIEHPGGVPTPPAVYARQNSNEMYLKTDK